MRKIALILILILVIPAAVMADMGPKLAGAYYGIGPSIGYSFSDNLGGFTLGFDAATSFMIASLSGGMRYIFSKDDGNDFRDNSGLLTVYGEATILNYGLGLSYNFALGSGETGPGLHMAIYFSIPAQDTGYVSVFYRRSWIWLNGNAEGINELGLSFKFSDYWDQQKKYQKNFAERRRKYMERKKKLIKDK